MNPSTITEILNPVQGVKLRAETVLVRELNWLATRSLLAAIAKKLEEHLVPEKGLVLNAQSLSAVIKETQDLAENLILGTTGKDQAWLETITVGEFFGVLDVALELNLKVITESAKKIGGRLQQAFGDGAARTTQSPP